MVTVRVPATSANLGPGFDTLGMAIDLFLTVEAINAKATSCHFIGEGQSQLNISNKENFILTGLKKVFQEAQEKMPTVKMTVNNQIPIGKGLGSSAAAILAGVLIGNHLLNQKFNTDQIIKIAADLEGHADNVVPAMVGGLTTVMEYDGAVYFQKVEMPDSINVIIAVPDFELSTHKSRQVLPEKVDLHDTVANLQRACMLLASIFNGDFRHIDMAMDDKIYQPLRKQFIPGFDEVLREARAAGASGVALSGAGPSIIAFAVSGDEMIGKAMQDAFSRYDVSCQILNLKPNKGGALIL